MKKPRLSGVLCACVFALLFIPASHAATVQYVYTGNPFTDNDATNPLCTLGDPGCFTNITATIELSTPLGNGLALQAITPLAWSISDGRTTITDQTADFGLLFPLEVGTDGLGNIDKWRFDVARTNTQPLGELNEIRTTAGAGIAASDDTRYCTVFNAGSCSYIATAFVNNPGSWAMTTVPVPAAAWLFGSGMLGLIGIGRRRRHAG